MDIGTTGCKTVVYSTDGKLLANAYREYPVLHKQPGWAELDSKAVWNLVCETLGEVSTACHDDPIQSISASSLGEAMTPVTADRKILDHSILCMDTRGKEYADQLLGKISQHDFYAINPNLVGPAYSMPKLRWIKDHNTAIYNEADWFLTWGDFVSFMLGGNAVICAPLAARTLLFDLKNSDWSHELLKLCALEDLTDKLPPVVPAGQITGTVSPHVADKLGLAHDVKLVAGGHDQCCNALGAGVAQAGQAVYGIGTFECITPVFNDIPNQDVMLRAGLCIEDHVLPGKYVTFIYNQGGSLVKWFRDTFAKEMAQEVDDIYERLCDEMPEKPTTLFTLPYFEPTGPPNYVSDGPGGIVGLKSTTTRGDILKSIMESVTYYLADASDCLEAVGGLPTMFVATGGGAKSDRWLQLKADIFGVPFIRNNTVECSALGAAMLAGIGTGLITADTDAFIKAERVFEPNAANHAAYRQRLAEYQTWVKRIITPDDTQG